jgi:hypothetical protein
MKRLASILISSSFLLLSSCGKSFLETTPYTSIESSSAFSTAERVNAAMNGLYDLITTSTYNTQASLTSDVKGGDLLVVSTGNYNRFVTEYQYLQSPTAGYGTGFWRDGYKLITNCNVAITEIPKSTTLTDGVKSDYLAEARALRAWGHLQLIRLFAQPFAVDPASPGVPIVDKVLTASDKTPPRASVKEVYDFILADLLFAKDNISPTRSNNGGRLTLNAVNALLARVYLDIKVWDKAAESAKLARAGYALPAGDELLKGFVDKTSEWIWTLVYRSDDNTGYVQIASFLEPYDQGYSTFRATKSFIDLFSDTDIRRKQFFVNLDILNGNDGDPLKRDDLAFSRDGYLMNKFLFRGAWDLNVPMIRSAEMYLIEAEAESEQSHDGPAQDALFAVQKRAIPEAVKSINTGAALKLEIRDERRKELFGEGFRLYDLTRKQETLVRKAPEHWSAITLAPGDYRNILPIPRSEIDVSGLKQNTGYPQ